MGHTIWVDVRGRAKNVALPDNSIMLRLQCQLDDLSTKLDVAKLSEFYDYSEPEAAYGDFDGEGDESGDGEGGEAEYDNPAGEDGQDEGVWSEPGPALGAVRAIHDHLVDHPQDLGFEPDPSQSHWPGDLIKELVHCRSVLEEAATRGQDFRFLIVP